LRLYHGVGLLLAVHSLLSGCRTDIRIARPSFAKKRTTKLSAGEIVLFSIRSYRTGNVHVE